MHENRFNEYRIPSGMLIVFLEKALTLIHMETHLDDVSAHTQNTHTLIKKSRGIFKLETQLPLISLANGSVII
jgi:hypothetical protein